MRKAVEHDDVEHACAESVGRALRHQRATLRKLLTLPVRKRHAVEFDLSRRRLLQAG